MRLIFALSAAAVLLSACSSRPIPAPPPPRPVAPPVAPLPAPAPVLSGKWEDWPLSPGNWVYRQDERGSIALFGKPGLDADLMLRCDRGARRLYLSRAGRIGDGDAADMVVRASSGVKTFRVRGTGDTPPYVAVELAPTEPHLDVMAFSRGKFIISIKGGPDLVIPPWAEFSRVIEDCRG
jgi:hypothetical protein